MQWAPPNPYSPIPAPPPVSSFQGLLPTHRDPVGVFFPDLLAFLFPILKGMVLLVLELHDGAQAGSDPPGGAWPPSLRSPSAPLPARSRPSWGNRMQDRGPKCQLRWLAELARGLDLPLGREEKSQVKKSQRRHPRAANTKTTRCCVGCLCQHATPPTRPRGAAPRGKGGGGKFWVQSSLSLY